MTKPYFLQEGVSALAKNIYNDINLIEEVLEYYCTRTRLIEPKINSHIFLTKSTFKQRLSA